MKGLKNRRILFGAVDVGYRIEHYTRFIKDHPEFHLDPESLSIYVLPDDHYKTTYTYAYQFKGRSAVYRWGKAIQNFCRAVLHYDIFHFFSGETLLPRKLRGLELRLYKMLGKRIIMHFVGSDIRSPLYLARKNNDPKSIPEQPISERWQQKLISDARKYADMILVSTPDLKKLIPEATYYPVLLDLDKFNNELESSENIRYDDGKIRILHSPSNAILKGSVHIDQALQKLKSKYPEKVEIIRPVYTKNENTGSKYSTSRYKLFSLYRHSDIVIDQMVIGWYGLQTVEALAAGKEVICYIDSELTQNLFPGCPVIMADIENLYAVIEHTFLNFKGDNSERNKTWVEQYHTIGNNHQVLLDAWDVRVKSLTPASHD